MPIEHVIYIPCVLFVGALAGYVLGVRAAHREVARKKERIKE
jgi:hypothetical protein